MLWLRVAAAAATVAAGAWVMVRRRPGAPGSSDDRPDHHWGDWPPDHMAP